MKILKKEICDDCGDSPVTVTEDTYGDRYCELCRENDDNNKNGED